MSEFIHPPPGPPIAAINAIDRPKPNKYADKRLKRSIADAKKKQKLESPSATQTISADAASQLEQRSVSPRRGDNSPIRSPRHDDGVGATRTLSPRGQFETPLASRPIQPIGIDQGKMPIMIPAANIKPLSAVDECNLLTRDYDYLEYVATFFSNKLLADYMFDMDKLAGICQAITRDWKSDCLSLTNIVAELGCTEWKQLCQRGVEVEVRPIEQHYIRELLVTLSQILGRTLLNSVAQLCALPITIVSQDSVETDGFDLHYVLSMNSNAYIWDEYLKAMTRYNTDVVIPNNSYTHLLARGRDRANWSPQFLKEFAEAKMAKLDVRPGSKSTNVATFQLNEPVKFQKMFTSLSDVLAASAAVYNTFPEIFVDHTLKQLATSTRNAPTPEELSFYVSQLISGVIRSLDYITQKVVNVSLDSSPAVVGLPLLLRNIFLIADHDPTSFVTTPNASEDIMRSGNDKHHWNYATRIVLPRTFAMYNELGENAAQSFSDNMTPLEVEAAILDVIRECDYLKTNPLFKDDQLKLIPKLSLLFPDAKTMDTIQAAINPNNKVIEQLFYGIIPFTVLDRATQMFATFSPLEGTETEMYCLTPKIEAQLSDLFSSALDIPMPIDGFAGTATDRQVHYDASFIENDSLLPPMGASYLLQRHFNLRPLHGQMEAELIARRAVTASELSKLQGAKRDSLLMQSWLAWASRDAHSNQLYQDERLDSPLSKMAHDIKSRPKYAAFYRNLLYDIRAMRRNPAAEFSQKTRSLLADMATYIKSHDAYLDLLDYIELAEEDERTATADLNGGEGVARLLRAHKVPLIRPLPSHPVAMSLFAMPASDYIDQSNQFLLGTSNIAYKTVNSQAGRVANTGSTLDPLLSSFKASVDELLTETSRDLLGLGMQIKIGLLAPSNEKNPNGDSAPLYKYLITEATVRPDEDTAFHLSWIINSVVTPFLGGSKASLFPPRFDPDLANNLRDLVRSCQFGTMPLFLTKFNEKLPRDRRLYLWIVTDIVRMIITYYVLALVNIDRLKAIVERLGKTSTMADALSEYLEDLSLKKGLEDDKGLKNSNTDARKYELDSKYIKYLILLQRTAAEISDKRKFEWASGSGIMRMSHMAATTEGKRRIRSIVMMLTGKAVASVGIVGYKLVRQKIAKDALDAKKKVDAFRAMKNKQKGVLKNIKALDRKMHLETRVTVPAPESTAVAIRSWREVDQDPTGNFFLFLRTKVTEVDPDATLSRMFPEFDERFGSTIEMLIADAPNLEPEEVAFIMDDFEECYSTLKWMEANAVGEDRKFYTAAIDHGQNITYNITSDRFVKFGEYLSDLNIFVQRQAGFLIDSLANRAMETARKTFTPDFDQIVKDYVPTDANWTPRLDQPNTLSRLSTLLEDTAKASTPTVSPIPPFDSIKTSAEVIWAESLAKFAETKWELGKVAGSHAITQYGAPYLLNLIASKIRSYTGDKSTLTGLGVYGTAYVLMGIYLLCPEEKMPEIITSRDYGVKLDAEWDVPEYNKNLTEANLDELYNNKTLKGTIRYQLLDVCLPSLTRTNVFSAAWNIFINGGWGLALGALVQAASTIMRCTIMELGSQAVTMGGLTTIAGIVGTFGATLALDVLTPLASQTAFNFYRQRSRRDRKLAKKVDFKVDVKRANKFSVLVDQYGDDSRTGNSRPPERDEGARGENTASQLRERLVRRREGDGGGGDGSGVKASAAAAAVPVANDTDSDQWEESILPPPTRTPTPVPKTEEEIIKEAYEKFIGDSTVRNKIYARMIGRRQYPASLSDSNSPHYKFLKTLNGARNEVNYRDWLRELSRSVVLDEDSPSDFVLSNEAMSNDTKLILKKQLRQASTTNMPLDEETYQLSVSIVIRDLLTTDRDILIDDVE